MRLSIYFIAMLFSQFICGQNTTNYTQFTYRGSIQGVSALLKIEPGSMHNDQTANRYYGQLAGDDGSSYILMGNLITYNMISGSIWDQFTTQEFKFSITFNDSGLMFSFGIEENSGTTIAFSRELNAAGIIDTARGEIDPRLVGGWRRTESHSDPVSSFSFVIEQTLVLNRDGSCVFYSKSAGGTSSVTGGTNDQELRGYWKTEGQQLFTRDHANDQWMNNGAYIVDQKNLMLKQSEGNKLWSRIQ